MNAPESRWGFARWLVLAALLGNGCMQPAQAPPPPPPGPPPPELMIGDDETQGEAEPPAAPAAPEPTQVPVPPGAPPPRPAEAGQMAPPPQAAAPANPPPAPQGPAALAPPAMPAMQPAPAEPPAPNGGQWTYTSQYGWLWMPYSRDYTSVSSDGGAAYEYVYYPDGGWRWVYAPWVLGWGPSPYWGRLGPRHYVWYSRPWFRVGVVHRGPVYHRTWHRR